MFCTFILETLYTVACCYSTSWQARKWRRYGLILRS